MLVQLLDETDDVCGFIHEWVATLAGNIETLDVLTLRTGQMRLPANVRVHVLKPHGSEGKLTATARFYRSLLHIVRQGRVDVIFCHMTPIYSVVAAPVAAVWRIPIVTWYTHETVSLVLRLAERVSAKILTASPESFQLNSRKVLVTNHGINTRRFSPSETVAERADACLHVCSVGRLSPRKDYETLLRALHILVHTHRLHHIRLVIVGKEGTLAQHAYVRQLRALVDDLKLGDYVKFAGAVANRDVMAYYHHSDIFVNMRQTGGMDKAVLEAMACGVPTVVCNATFGSLFGPLAHRLLFEERNPEALAARIRDLADLSPKERREMGLALRDAVVRHHNLDGLMTRIVDIFAHLQKDA